MKQLHIYASLICLACISFSCKTSAILRANFESDAVGALPAKTLPGDPAGDALTYVPELEPRLKVTASASAGEKALTFTQENAPGLTAHNQFIGFRGASTDLTQTLWFTINAKHTGPGGWVMIDISDGSASMISRLYINASGSVELIRAFPNDRITIGTIAEGTPHTIIFTVDVAHLKYNLSILKADGNILLNDQPTITRELLSFHNPATPSISMRFEDGSSSSRQYVIESASISRKQPSAP